MGVTHGCSPSEVSFLWCGSPMGHSPLRGTFALSESTCFQECISSHILSISHFSHISFHASPASPQVCPHIIPQVCPQVSLVPGSLNTSFLNTSKDHVVLWLMQFWGHSVVFPAAAKPSGLAMTSPGNSCLFLHRSPCSHPTSYTQRNLQQQNYYLWQAYMS